MRDCSLHATRPRPRRRPPILVPTVTAVIATEWIGADLVVPWWSRVACVVGLAVVIVGVVEFVRGEGA